MDFLHIVTQMLMIFGIVLVGLASAKRNLWAGELDRKLSVFILNVSMPALILASVMGKDLEFEASEVLTLSLVAVVNYVILIGMACLIPKIWHVNLSRQGLARFMLAFGNVSFIGYPVCDAVFGPKAVFCASVLNIPFNLLIFTIGVSFINGGKARSAFSPKLVFSPCVVASLIAVVIALMGISVPAPVGQWFHLLGDLTTPCALLIIGSSLANLPLKELAGSVRIWVSAFFRLIVSPLLVWGIFHFFISDPVLLGVMVIISSMPVATNGTLLCFQYGGDLKAMSQGTFITTLLSFAVIPLLVMFLSFVG